MLCSSWWIYRRGQEWVASDMNYFSSPLPAAFCLGFTKACDCHVLDPYYLIWWVCVRGLPTVWWRMLWTNGYLMAMPLQCFGHPSAVDGDVDSCCLLSRHDRQTFPTFRCFVTGYWGLCSPRDCAVRNKHRCWCWSGNSKSNLLGGVVSREGMYSSVSQVR